MEMDSTLSNLGNGYFQICKTIHTLRNRSLGKFVDCYEFIAILQYTIYVQCCEQRHSPSLIGSVGTGLN